MTANADEVRCLFTDERARRERDGYSTILQFTSTACGKYGIIAEFHEMAGQDLLTRSKQGRVNCARQSIVAGELSPLRIPVWVPRRYAERARAGDANKPPYFVAVLEDYLDEPVDHSAKPAWLLERLAVHATRGEGAFAPIRIQTKDRILARIVDEGELRHILLFMYEKAWIQPSDALAVEVGRIGPGWQQTFLGRILYEPLSMTVAGWAEIRRRSLGALTNKVFVAIQFKWPDEQLQARALEAIKSACKRNGFDAETVGQEHTDNITDRIVAEIKRARFVVAEFTYNNRGVYFEAGLARGLGIPVFHVVQEGFTEGEDATGTQIHFDVAQIAYRKWATPEELETKLADWIAARIDVASRSHAE